MSTNQTSTTTIRDIGRGYALWHNGRRIARHFSTYEAAESHAAELDIEAATDWHGHTIEADLVGGYYVVRDGRNLSRHLTREEAEANRAERVAAIEASQAEATVVEEQPLPEASPAQATVRGTITDAQAEQIMDLIHEGAHEEGGWYSGPTSPAGVLGMSREDAAQYIDSLTDRY